MNFQKVHGFELADNGFIKKLRPEVVSQDPNDITTAGRIWYNANDHQLKFSDMNDEGQLITRIVIDEEEVKKHTAAASEYTRGIELRTTDPLLSDMRAGRVWLNTTTRRLKFASGTTASEVYEFTHGGQLDAAVVDAKALLKEYADISITHAVSVASESLTRPTTPLTPTEIAAAAAAEIAAINAKVTAETTIAAARAAAAAVKKAADIAEENLLIAEEAVIVAAEKAAEAVRLAAEAAAVAKEEATATAEENAEKAAEVVRIATEVAAEAVAQATALAQANARTATANAELAALAAEEAVRLATVAAEAAALDESISTAITFCEHQTSSVIRIQQAAHGFPVMTPLYKGSTEWGRAKADSVDTLSSIVVTNIIDADTFEATQIGRLHSMSHGMTVGEYYYLSDTESGTLSLIKPELAHPVLLVEDENNVLVMHYVSPMMDREETDRYRWKDLPSAFTTQNYQNPTAAAWAKIGTSNFSGYRFEADAQTELQTLLNMNHDYALGTAVYYHIHWIPENNEVGVVRWGIELAWAKSHQRGTFDLNDTLTIFVEKETSGKAFEHMTSQAMISSITADLEPDCIILMRIYRDSSHVNDTYPGNVFALQADMHYQAHLIGSTEHNPTTAT